jgi:hypothetical protein
VLELQYNGVMDIILKILGSIGILGALVSMDTDRKYRALCMAGGTIVIVIIFLI